MVYAVLGLFVLLVVIEEASRRMWNTYVYGPVEREGRVVRFVPEGVKSRWSSFVKGFRVPPGMKERVEGASRFLSGKIPFKQAGRRFNKEAIVSFGKRSFGLVYSGIRFTIQYPIKMIAAKK